MNQTLVEKVEDDDLMVAVQAVVDAAGRQWQGTPTELLNAVNGMVPVRRHDAAPVERGKITFPPRIDDLAPGLTRDPKAGWPATARGLSDALARADVALRQKRIEFMRIKSNGVRMIRLVHHSE